MEGSAPHSVDRSASWLRCYRCWSQNLEVQFHYEGLLKVDPETAEAAADPLEEVHEAVVQCHDCLHDQPHLRLSSYEENGRRVNRIEAVEERWERMITGTPWVASCMVTVDGEDIECSGPEAAESLSFAAFGDPGTREFFTHVRYHKHQDDKIVVHVLVELYARSAEEATQVLEEAARGALTITSLAEESRPPAATGGGEHPH
jgi:hypothetical protein